MVHDIPVVDILYQFPDGTTAPDKVSHQDLVDIIEIGIPVLKDRYALYSVNNDGSQSLIGYYLSFESARTKAFSLLTPYRIVHDPIPYSIETAKTNLDLALSLHEPVSPPPAPPPEPPITEPPPSTQDPTPGTQDPQPQTEFISISPGVFKIINGRVRGEALFIASSDLFTNLGDPVRARAFMQVSNMSGQSLAIKGNGLFFSNAERDERIQYDENAFNENELQIELFVWKENEAVPLAPSKRFVINSGPVPADPLPPPGEGGQPPAPVPTKFSGGILAPLITGALLLGAVLSFKRGIDK